MGYISKMTTYGALGGLGTGMADYGNFKIRDDANREMQRARFAHTEALTETRREHDLGMAKTDRGFRENLEETKAFNLEMRDETKFGHEASEGALDRQSAERIQDSKASASASGRATAWREKFNASGFKEEKTFLFGNAFGAGEAQGIYNQTIDTLTAAGVPESEARKQAMNNAIGAKAATRMNRMMSDNPKLFRQLYNKDPEVAASASARIQGDYVTASQESMERSNDEFIRKWRADNPQGEGEARKPGASSGRTVVEDPPGSGNFVYK